jgi:hypothetical protein
MVILIEANIHAGYRENIDFSEFAKNALKGTSNPQAARSSRAGLRHTIGSYKFPVTYCRSTYRCRIVDESRLERTIQTKTQNVQSALGSSQKVSKRLDERRKVVPDGVPDNGRTKAPVGMNREVAQINHLPPGYFRVEARNLRRNMICGLADDGEVVNNCVHDLFVVCEGFKICTRDITLDLGDGIENILDAECPISKLHE